jgi:hypothetical protein
VRFLCRFATKNTAQTKTPAPLAAVASKIVFDERFFVGGCLMGGASSVVVGLAVGEAEGLAVGDLNGASVGGFGAIFFVGAFVGASVGASVGAFVGSFVEGGFVGALVGSFVERGFVGALVGFFVEGGFVGALVGISVGDTIFDPTSFTSHEYFKPLAAQIFVYGSHVEQLNRLVDTQGESNPFAFAFPPSNHAAEGSWGVAAPYADHVVSDVTASQVGSVDEQLKPKPPVAQPLSSRL